ncbi:MAG TPA: 2-hydroxychromene-2-carboxylate isomerase [Casimicrobiaceae bacterium]|nr:2-hydroxychromene-2-carboxylate isomerase [Casimicrobiaceae bacterium]
MTRRIDYYFTPISPWSYLGHQRFVAIAARHGASVDVKPVDYGRVFPASGGLPLKQRAPQRQAYRLIELARWSTHLGVPLNPEPRHFPVAAGLAAKWILAVVGRSGDDDALRLAGALLRAVWAEERNIADAATVAAIAREQGLDPQPLADLAATTDVAARYDALTQEAIDRQVFGAPTYIYRDEPFWGQDRLDFLDRALAK